MNQLSSSDAADGGQNGRATIADVARAAQASKASVSRYLGGNLGALSDALRERIQVAIEALGYCPSPIARSLKGGHTGLIGMLAADIDNPWSVAVLHGAEAACQQHGFSLILSNSGGDPVREQKMITALLSYRVEGLVVNAAGPARSLMAALSGDVPVVLVDRKPDGCGFDFVGLDNVAAMDTVVGHLTGEGFLDLALVIQPVKNVSTRQERAAGFRAAVRRAPGCRGDIVEIEQADPAAVDRALKTFLAAPTGGAKAVIAANGLMTLRVVQCLDRLGLRMPQDVGLVGFDELDWCALVPPGITTFGQPTYDIGATAVRRLLARVSGERSNTGDTIFSGKLIARHSSSGALAHAGRPM
jgi:LacI family transcriptional regulator, kdg operon repressor